MCDLLMVITYRASFRDAISLKVMKNRYLLFALFLAKWQFPFKFRVNVNILVEKSVELAAWIRKMIRIYLSLTMRTILHSTRMHKKISKNFRFAFHPQIISSFIMTDKVKYDWIPRILSKILLLNDCFRNIFFEFVHR